MPGDRAVLEGGGHHVGVHRVYRHPWLRALQRALLDEPEAEIESTLSVAVLVAAGYDQTEIAGRLGLSLGDVRMAVRQLERVAPHL